MLRLRGVRSIVKPPGTEEQDEKDCPDRLLLLAQEVAAEGEGEGEGPVLAGVALGVDMWTFSDRGRLVGLFMLRTLDPY